MRVLILAADRVMLPVLYGKNGPVESFLRSVPASFALADGSQKFAH